jgi:hypothetical protein
MFEGLITKRCKRFCPSCPAPGGSAVVLIIKHVNSMGLMDAVARLSLGETSPRVVIVQFWLVGHKARFEFLRGGLPARINEIPVENNQSARLHL